jgi:hypothetical protein
MGSGLRGLICVPEFAFSKTVRGCIAVAIGGLECL